MKTLILLSALLTLPAIAGSMYEWKDPATGALRAGDKPPEDGVEYWVEGHRPKPQVPAAPESPAKPTKADWEYIPEYVTVWFKIRNSDYTCNKVDSATPLRTRRGYSVSCDDGYYKYDVIDYGGHDLVLVK